MALGQPARDDDVRDGHDERDDPGLWQLKVRILFGCLHIVWSVCVKCLTRIVILAILLHAKTSQGF